MHGRNFWRAGRESDYHCQRREVRVSDRTLYAPAHPLRQQWCWKDSVGQIHHALLCDCGRSITTWAKKSPLMVSARVSNNGHSLIIHSSDDCKRHE